MDALELGKYITTKFFNAGKPINNYHLQNILYIIQRYWLRNYNYVLFTDNFEAWSVGPVVPKVFYNFCCYGIMNITFNYAIDIDCNLVNKIDSVIDEYMYLNNPWDFMLTTHKVGGAWDNIYAKGAGVHSEIPYTRIRDDK